MLLISTYELGRQPFGLASPAAWLRAAGHQVTVRRYLLRSPAAARRWSRPRVSPSSCRCTPPPAFSFAWWTASAGPIPRRGSAAYGLYAPLNAALLRAPASAPSSAANSNRRWSIGHWARGETPGQLISPPLISLGRQQFLVPDRTGLPPLGAYAKLVTNGRMHRVGYTEASRGCKHLCRHCPVVPVYRGQFRVVQRDIVLADIRQQVAAGAEHITFGDPDFFNGPGHAIPIVEALHREWPGLTYDATIKVEHLLKHRDLLPVLKRTGLRCS